MTWFLRCYLVAVLVVGEAADDDGLFVILFNLIICTYIC